MTRTVSIGKSPRQCQRPRGWIGRFLLWTMNRSHSAVTDWGLGHVTIGERDTVLDVGCGGGRTVAKLSAAASKGKVYGIDFAEASVAVSRRTNRRLIDEGRVEIQQASVSHLPFADHVFDVATAVETHFWWADMGTGMREILRVLKPGGRLAIIAEFYNGAKHARYASLLAARTTMALLDVAQHEALFSDAGFIDVRVVEEPAKGWICGVGTKPR